MASQDARLSKFEADFKQQQSKMTNKIDTFLKAINDRMMEALSSDTVKNHKLKLTPPIRFRLLVLTRLKTLTVNKIGTPKPKEPEKALEDEFKDLHLKLLVLEFLAHAPMYNAILDKYVESLELGKNRYAFIQGEMPKKMKDPGLFTLPCRLGDSNTFDTLADLGSCVNLIPLYLFKKIKIRLLEETENVLGLADGTKSYPVGIVRNVEVHLGKLKLLEEFYVIDMEKDPTCPLLVPDPLLCKKYFMNYHLPEEWEIARDDELNLFKDVLVFRKMVEFLGTIPINLKRNMWESKELIEKKIDWNKPPKEGDGAWHIKIELIDPDGKKFNKTFQSIPITRKLSEKENPSEIIDLEHFHDS
ncbi:DNA-directed DNA polymerase [Tanacetum coccineum]